ncbi:MAG: M20/M25/M40 family metallo-hydrolase [Gemmatimonadota bacterium]
MNGSDISIRGAAATLVGGLLLALTPHAALPQQSCPDPDGFADVAKGALAHVRYLADDALEGRAAASEGERCAAAYLADRLGALGLVPAGDHGAWLQSFSVRTGTAVEEARLVISGADAGAAGAGWAPFGFSASGSVTAPLRVVSPPDPHAAHDVALGEAHGRIAVISVDGSVQVDAHFLAASLARAGAAGMILLYPDAIPLPDPGSEIRPAVGVPSAAATGRLAESVRRAAAARAEASIAVAAAPSMSEARNVVALLPGDDPDRASEPIIVGAHYDHLGRGGPGSLAPDSREIHNGADDNASGTAALLEVARRLSEGPGLDRPVLFVAFSGEERGLLGSAHFVSHPTRPIDGAVAMLNMDMVGRLRDEALAVHGLGTAQEWDAILDAANSATDRPLSITRVADGFGPSDHSSFYGAGVPVLFFFTNTHADYHRPSDDWDSVNGEGIERVAGLVAEVVRRLAGDEAAPAPAITLVRGAGNPHGAASGDEPAPSGYGPYLGSIPDMTPIEGGVRLTGVREGSPAEKAGLREGDVIVSFAGRDIDDLYAFTYALRESEPGDAVDIVVLRDGEPVSLRAVLERRR